PTHRCLEGPIDGRDSGRFRFRFFDTSFAGTTICARSAFDSAMSARPQPPAQIHAPPPAEARPLAVAVPIDVRSTSLAVLALIGSIVFLHWAQAVLIPIPLRGLLRYAL